MKKKESKSAIVITCDCLSITNNEITKTARWREIKIQLCKWHCLRHAEEAWEKRMGSSKEKSSKSWAMSAITCSEALSASIAGIIKNIFRKKGVVRARAFGSSIILKNMKKRLRKRSLGLWFCFRLCATMMWIVGAQYRFFFLNNFHIWFCKHKVY